MSQEWGFFSTGLILCSATIERFLAIAFPLKYRSWNTLRTSKIDRTLRTSKIVLSILLIISFLIMTFTAFFHEMPEKGKCVISEKYLQIYDLMFTILLTVIANGICGGLIIIFTLVIIGLLFHLLRKRNVLSKNNSANSSSKNEVRVSVMLVPITLLFISFRFPIAITAVTVKFLPLNSIDPVLFKMLLKIATFLKILQENLLRKVVLVQSKDH